MSVEFPLGNLRGATARCRSELQLRFAICRIQPPSQRVSRRDHVYPQKEKSIMGAFAFDGRMTIAFSETEQASFDVEAFTDADSRTKTFHNTGWKSKHTDEPTVLFHLLDLVAKRKVMAFKKPAGPMSGSLLQAMKSKTVLDELRFSFILWYILPAETTSLQIQKWNTDHPDDAPVGERMPYAKKGITLKKFRVVDMVPNVCDPPSDIVTVAAHTAETTLSCEHNYVFGGSWVEWGRPVWTVTFRSKESGLPEGCKF
jgi:hypothetical protein